MKEENRRELQKICEVICETVPTIQIYLFGSFAYGQPNEDSDYDLYVVLPDDGPRPMEAIAQISHAVYPWHTRPVDIVANHESTFLYRRTGVTLQREIYRKGVLLYDKNRVEPRVV